MSFIFVNSFCNDCTNFNRTLSQSLFSPNRLEQQNYPVNTMLHVTYMLVVISYSTM